MGYQATCCWRFRWMESNGYEHKDTETQRHRGEIPGQTGLTWNFPSVPLCLCVFVFLTHQGICRFVNFLPISVACWLAGPTITPSLIMSTMFIGFIEFRKNTLFALQAAKTLARAA